MKVLVTGATGFVGREVLKQLQAAGHKPRLLVRDEWSPDNRELARRHGGELRGGDVLDPGVMVGAADGCEGVIHLVGILSEIGEQIFEYVHHRGTRNVLRASENAGVRRFIHVSALGTRANAASVYHQTKWMAEEEVRTSKLDWTIFRPSLIFGPGDHCLSRFDRLARLSPILPVFGSGRRLMQPVAVEDVAACLVRSLDEPRASRQVVDLCGPDRPTLRQMLREVLCARRRYRLLLPVPMLVARPVARWLEWVYPWYYDEAAPLTRDQLLMLQEDNIGNPQPAEDILGLKMTPFGEGIRRCFGR